MTHPDVVVDPATPIDRWSLSPSGRDRAHALLEHDWVATTGRIVSSDETKAVETAEILASHLRLHVEVRSGIGENDRSATGYLPAADFERMADRFFAHPTISADGWERAVDAQARIVAGLADLLRPVPAEDIVVVGHGGVGTLWYCSLTGQPISREHDQPGHGHHFTVDTATQTVIHPWRPIDHT